MLRPIADDLPMTTHTHIVSGEHGLPRSIVVENCECQRGPTRKVVVATEPRTERHPRWLRMREW